MATDQTLSLARNTITSEASWAVATFFFGVLVIIGIIAWLRCTQHTAPTNPASPKVPYVLPAPRALKTALPFRA